MSPWLIWFLIGLVFIVAEFAVPGIILVFFGIGAWLVALLLALNWVEALSTQLLVFSFSSLALLFLVRRLARDWFSGHLALPSASSDLKEEFQGKAVRVLTAFANPGALGKVEFKGAEWNARSEDELAVGDPAEIIAVEGLTLRIRRRWLDADLPR